MLQVVWFKRDLRVADHAPLSAAVARGPVLPLYIVEPDLWRQPDASGRQWAFTAECLLDLRERIGALGQPLVVRMGDAVEVLEAIRRSHDIAALWSHQETGNGWTFARDLRVGAWARAHGIAWTEIRQYGVTRRLRDRNGWAAAWDKQMRAPITSTPRGLPAVPGIESGVVPDVEGLGLPDDPCPGRQFGGRTRGLALLESFLAVRGRDYRRQMSGPLTAEHACSRLSAHLALGTISIREALQAAETRLEALRGDPTPAARAWRGSVDSFVGRLHWHCHFIQKLESEPRLEFEDLHPACRELGRVEDPALVAAWARGETGLPFVDACMRSLRATGWLTFRMRAMVMAVASYHLWQPWRPTGLALARLFTDYEPGIHWPQAQMQSGTTGINTPRIYNPVKQGHDHDPDGLFIRRWVPELSGVPDGFLHEPWTWEEFDAAVRGRYPRPIVDHAAAARAARERIFAIRRSRDARAASDAIQEKHGSRKSGIAMTGRKKTSPRQLSLDL
jgi:deoxyribodipyrimidine photo-lyase